MNKLIAYHIAFLSHKGAGADMTTPIEKMWEASVWETHSDSSTTLSAQQRLPELWFPSSEIHFHGFRSTHGSAGLVGSAGV